MSLARLLHSLPLLLALPLAHSVGLGCDSHAAGSVAQGEQAERGESTLEAKGGDEAEVWSADGIIKRIEPERGTVTIHHEDVPGYMPSMTMPFWVESASQLEGLAVGDAVSFRFRRGDGGKHFLVSIQKKR